jgi:adenylylsulfate kinase
MLGACSVGRGGRAAGGHKPTRKPRARIEYGFPGEALRPLNTNNLVPHRSLIGREQREAANGHKAAVIWFTGLPASGKSTTAHAVEERLFHAGCQAYTLDGDNVRHGLSADLGFSPAERAEHLRRIGELAKLMYGAGMIVLCAFVSPTRGSREGVRRLLPDGAFVEIYCRCPIEVCERRDEKGFYARARRGEIPDYTGVSAPYEEPLAPDLVLDTAANGVVSCVARVLEHLHEREIVPHPSSGSRRTRK